MLISDCFEINVPKSGSTGSQHWVSFYWSAFDRFEAWKLYIALFFCVLPGDCRAASHGLYFTKFQRGHTLRGAKDRRGIKISRFSTNKSLYLANDTRYCHSYYGRRIWTCMRSIEWCHFQWSWTNPNPVFKVIPLFDAKYLKNGYIYGHSYYRRRIGNRT